MGPLRDLQRKRKDETIAKAAQCHKKAKAALLEHRYQQPSSAGRKGNPGAN